MFGTTGLFDELQRIQQEMERVFGSAPWANGIRSSSTGFPPVNVGTTADEVDVYFFAPGVNPESWDISIQNNVLSVAGERHVIREEGASYYRKERFDGEFRRTFSLPDDIDPEKVDASYKNGVLHVRLQRKESSKPRQIKVN
ncbi:Hsp20/alpha crystallin family protein [Thiolapillus brandeum]|uniref:Heat shock protein HSP20 n=1 Tax=Thiolapillus brandeum TaxID=1076588 RepID=A0A7U6JHD4_9GAMM|nr:Hsp20/alpha crystallin family protein [Thiolapillus brandeum]BAO44196.1 heat shock protein HSP20 [Thiolapillus brandeum]